MIPGDIVIYRGCIWTEVCVVTRVGGELLVRTPYDQTGTAPHRLISKALSTVKIVGVL